MSRGTRQQYAADNLAKLIGITLGLILGWMIIEYGILQTFFVLFLIGIGYFVGKQADDGDKLSSLVDRIFKR